LIYKNMEKKYKNIIIKANTEKEIGNIIKALKLVERESKPYGKKLQTLRIILVLQNNKDYDNELLAEYSIWICNKKTILESSTKYLASLLVHEARHLMQYDTKKFAGYGKKPDKRSKELDEQIETDAYKTQRNFLKKLKAEREVEWLDKQFNEKWWVNKTKKGITYSFPLDKTFYNFLNDYKNSKIEYY